MKKNQKSSIFTFVLITIIIVMGVVIIKMSSDNNTDTENGTVSSDDEQLLSEDELEEQQLLEKEKDSYANEYYNAGVRTHKGEYENRSDSREVNTDFITEEYKFRQIYTQNEIEFLGYEEIDDISEYLAGANWAGDDIADFETSGFTYAFNYYIESGVINKDGTFNKVTQRISEKYSNWDFGEENILENQEVVAVKLKVKYTNLSAKKNEVQYALAHPIEDFVFLDDGKLYRKTSVYGVSISPSTLEPIYTNMSKKYKVEEGIVYPNIIVLEPKEEYIGEVIYVFLKEDLDDIYFVMHSGLYGADTIENFNAVGVKLLPLTELKKLEEK